MGKTIGSSLFEIDLAEALINNFCSGAEKWLANEPIEEV